MKKLLFLLVFLFFSVVIIAGPVDQKIDKILKEYFKIHESLTQDSTDGINKAAASIKGQLSNIQTDSAEVQKLVSEIGKAAVKIQDKSLESSRETFFELSRPILIYLNKHHSDKSKYSRFYCSMVNKAWVQSYREVANPYHGSSMLRCGELIE